ncbi:MAG: putative lipoic acid-binding regulatory protein [Gammaproteobacteria bacterium]
MVNDPSNDSVFEFPCDFPIKAMGLASENFDALVVEIVARHVGDIREGAIALRSSKNGKYLAVTITFEARDQLQLDDLYRELSAHERILMVL